MENRIKDLREAKGWTLERLAAEMGRSISAVSQLEKGGTRLKVDDLHTLARLFGVHWTEIVALPVRGLKEDAVPFKGDAEHPFAGVALKPNQDLWEVKTDVLDAMGIDPGDLVVVDISQQAVDDAQIGDAVLVQVYETTEKLAATTLLRQYIEPDLFITNSTKHNELPLNRKVQDVRIKGVVVGRMAAMMSPGPVKGRMRRRG